MEKTWNAALFRKAVSLAAEEGGISRAELYARLADLLNLSSRSIQSFAQPQSKGPSADRAEKLRQYFGVDFYIKDAEAVMLSKRLSGSICSDFEREHLLACRNLIRKYINRWSFCDDVGRYQLMAALEDHLPILPESARMGIVKYVADTLAPLAERIDEALSHAGAETEDGHVSFERPEEFFRIIFQVTSDALDELDRALLPSIITS